jgi:pyruvate ferredoxin oxidoreductase delta subunit
MKKDIEPVGIGDDSIKFDQKAIPILNTNASEAPKIMRIFKPKIDLSKCQNSYNCIVYCPYDAIDKNDKGRPVIDYNLCTGCLICLRECPTNAISEERR